MSMEVYTNTIPSIYQVYIRSKVYPKPFPKHKQGLSQLIIVSENRKHYVIKSSPHLGLYCGDIHFCTT